MPVDCRVNVMKSVLVIDSDKSRRSFVVPMQEAGFRVVEEVESEAGVQRVLDDEHYLIILSEDMPAVASGELLPTLRNLTDSPMVVIGSGGEASMVQALLHGADVYLTRPVNINELLARIRALLRRYGSGGEARGEAYLSVLVNGGHIREIFSRLSETEARLFHCLLERAEHLVAREELLAEVWGENGKDTSLRFYIWQLRRKLAEAASIEILNLKGMGYLLKLHPMGIR